MNNASLSTTRHTVASRALSRAVAVAMGLALVVGLLLMGAKWVAIILALFIAGMTLLTIPDLATPVMACILYSNAAVVAVRFYGVPRAAAAAAVLLLLIPVFHYLVVQRRKFVLAPAVPLILLFVAMQLLGTLLADRKEVALSSTLTTLTEGLILFVLLTNVIRNRLLLNRIIWTLLLVGSLLSGLSICQQVTGDFKNQFGGFAQTDFDERQAALGIQAVKSRAAGPIGEKNYYAQFMLMLVPLAFVQVRNARCWWRKAAALVAAALIGLAIAFTASRGAAVGFVAMLIAMLVLREVRWRHALLMTVAISALLAATPKYRERLVSIVGIVDVIQGKTEVRAIDASTKGRLTEMLAAALVFSEHPVLGVGPGNFPPHFLAKAGTMGFQVHAEERMAHCSYLEIAAENGLVGLSIYLGILAVSFHSLWRARREAPDDEARNIATGFLLALLVMVTTGIFLSFAFERYYWFILVLSSAACYAAPIGGVGAIGHGLSARSPGRSISSFRAPKELTTS